MTALATHGGSVATLKTVREEAPRKELGVQVSGRQLDQAVDEQVLSANIIVADPPRLPFRGMFIASYPASARRAASKARKLCLAFTRR